VTEVHGPVGDEQPAFFGVETRTCRRCGSAKSIEEFPKRNAKTPHSRQNWCRACCNEYYRAYRNDPVRREEILKKSRAAWASDTDRNRNRRLQHHYGITLAQYNEMLEEQQGQCAICRGANADARALVVDHDHACCAGHRSCGACVRGLLCHHCNVVLAMAKDDPSTLRAAVRYLHKNAGVARSSQTGA
jgi:hypothetical protein